MVIFRSPPGIREGNLGGHLPGGLLVLGLALGPIVGGCGDGGGGRESGDQGTLGAEAPPSLGPVDGHHLPPTDIHRVAVGSPAPDFALPALSGDTLALSDFRGARNVVLVFYRGHW